MMTSNEAGNPAVAPDLDEGCGKRLRRAREAAGLSVAEVGARLKMPVKVVESLEAEDWSRLGAPVFVRGQLRSYGRLMGLVTSQVAISAGAPLIVEPSLLTPRTQTPPMQRFVEQVARRLVYIVITAAIAVPVWLATRPHLETAPDNAAPLDLPAGALGSRAGEAQSEGAGTGPMAVRASIAPLRALSTPAPGLVLQFHADSWLEVTGVDGTLLEKALVAKGQQRSYRPGQVGRVMLGNAAAVEVRQNGHLQELGSHLRANVARFAVSSDGSLVPVAE